jgi:hypothetical protein
MFLVQLSMVESMDAIIGLRSAPMAIKWLLMKRNHSYNRLSLWISADALLGLLTYMRWLISCLFSGILPPLLPLERIGSQSSLSASQRSKPGIHGDIIGASEMWGSKGDPRMVSSTLWDHIPTWNTGGRYFQFWWNRLRYGSNRNY